MYTIFSSQTCAGAIAGAGEQLRHSAAPQILTCWKRCAAMTRSSTAWSISVPDTGALQMSLTKALSTACGVQGAYAVQRSAS